MTDTVPDLNLAPGCFGLAMTYRAGARECSICPFASACAPLAAENLAILRAELSIPTPAPLPPVVPVAKVKNGEVLVAGPLPKKVEAQLERAERLRIKITLARGENPFAGKKPAFLAVAFHVLLKMKAGVSRDTLVACFMSKLGHNQKTAVAHVRQTVLFLEAVGAGHEHNGMIKLRKAA